MACEVTYCNTMDGWLFFSCTIGVCFNVVVVFYLWNGAQGEGGGGGGGGCIV